MPKEFLHKPKNGQGGQAASARLSVNLAGACTLVISIHLESDLCALVHLHAGTQVIPAEVEHRLIGTFAPGPAGFLHLLDLSHHVRRIHHPLSSLDEAPALAPVEDLHLAREGSRTKDYPVLKTLLSHRDAAR